MRVSYNSYINVGIFQLICEKVFWHEHVHITFKREIIILFRQHFNL